MSDKLFKLFLAFVALYFLGHIGAALAETVLINTPDGRQTICVIVGSVIQCY